MALSSLQQGKLDLALSCLAKLCRQRNTQAQHLITYAEVLRLAKRHDEALTYANRAVAKDPGFASGWETLGAILAASGKLKEALESFEKAVSLNPRSVSAINNLGLLLQNSGQLNAASARYRQALALSPGNIAIKINLAAQQGLCGHTEVGLDLIKEVLERDPSNLQALLLASMLAVAADKHELCLTWAEKILTIAPGHPQALHQKGLALQALDRIQDALDTFDLAARADANSAAALTSKAALLAEVGDKKAALEIIEKAILADVNFTPAWHLRTSLVRYTPGDPDFSTMEKLYANPGIPRVDKLNLAFCLGKAYLDVGDGALAFDYLGEGASIKRSMIDYDPEADKQRFSAIIAAFSASRMDQFGSTGVRSGHPIFIFGMPRSGTTLIEQILASHPRVHGLGETNHLPNIVSKPGFFDALPDMKADQFTRIGQRYLELISANVQQEARLTDKLPSNFHHAGLIALCLPGAKMIHSRRDPLDTCLSCYSILFEKGHEYTYKLEELGQFYRQYLGLMEHWRQVLPKGVMLEVDYESLVADPEPEVRRLLDFCDLPWAPSCLRFHETQRRVATASLAQVREPMYRSSVGRAEKFRPWLAKLEAALHEAG